MLIASVLLGVGLSYATAHFCPTSHASIGACAHMAAADHPGMSGTHEPVLSADDHPRPVVLCLAALAAILVVIVLNLFALGRAVPAAGSGGWRPTALPPVRGSPQPIALSLRRVAVLRI
ncbi:hypothetical protein [Nonomuraea dietziae]|uniref:hypothetical protein n=1 Tax=Nonomuraea dietziae TaxID=65515 RepID=UPI0033FEF4AA